MATDRRVCHLRLRTADAANAGRAVALIEDALRCASLPDAGARIVLVRRLTLGVLCNQHSSQSLALRFERAFEANSWRPVHGAAEQARSAGAVWFSDPLDAHLSLALRLARGAPAGDWYWPLAVTSFDPTRGARESLRRILRSLAAEPTAPAAVPAWVAAMAAAGHLHTIAAAIDPGDVGWLWNRTGLSGDDEHHMAAPVAPSRADAHSKTPPAAASVADAGRAGAAASARVPDKAAAAATRPGIAVAPSLSVGRFLRAALAAAGAPADAWLRHDTPAMAGHFSGVSRAVESALAGPREADAPAAAAAVGRAPAAPAIEPAHRDAAVDGADDKAVPAAAAAAAAWDHARPTRAAGLLLLLVVLQRVGYAEWAERQAPPGTPPRVVRCIWSVLLGRLKVPAEDPAWRLAALGDAGAVLRCPPACIAAPDGDGAPAGALSQPQAQAPGHALTASDGRLAAAWLGRCRRWLRVEAGIGPASLVLRPALLRAGATHIDVIFDLDHVDLRVRRAGLDIDPGWLPWLGRVVAFHYQRGARSRLK